MTQRQIGKYVLEERLGGGGMGEVYRGRVHGAAGFSRAVAIKLIRPAALASQRAIELLLREGRMLAALNHRNIVSVFDLDMSDGQPFLVMEYLEGMDLRALLRREAGPLPWETAAFVGAEVARGLAAAHSLSDADARQGIVHGDLSPANVMLCCDGAVKILDFGLVRASGVQTTGADLRGKLAYLAPEALAGVTLDHRADIYALGVLLYECLTGRTPYAASEPETLQQLQQRAPARSPAEHVASIPEPVTREVLAALHRDRGQRTQSAARLAEALDQALRGQFGAPELSALLRGDARDAAQDRTLVDGPPRRAGRSDPSAQTVVERPAHRSPERSADTGGAPADPRRRGRRIRRWGAGVAAGVALLGAVAAVLVLSRREPTTAPPAVPSLVAYDVVVDAAAAADAAPAGPDGAVAAVDAAPVLPDAAVAVADAATSPRDRGASVAAAIRRARPRRPRRSRASARRAPHRPDDGGRRGSTGIAPGQLADPFGRR